MSNGDNPLTFNTNKDGTISIKDSEGKEVRYVKESDLLAVKGGAEAAQTELKDAKATWNTSEADYKSQIDSAKQGKLAAEAKSRQLEENLNKKASAETELASVKQELETAKTSGEASNNTVLELRRRLVVTTFNVPEATVENKTIEQLDAYEEALKAVQQSKGAGGYATGGGGGAGAPETDMDRARRIVTEAFEKAGAKV